MFQKSDFLKKVGRNTITHAITFALVKLRLNSAMLNSKIYIQRLSAVCYTKQTIRHLSPDCEFGVVDLITITLMLCLINKS